MEPSQVIIRPVVSEKSYVLAANDKYTFRVHPDAHKTQIRQAIEDLFDVRVVEVRTASVKSKPKKSLVEGLKKSGGRNSNGRKTARHRGGGAKRLYRKVDFKRRKDGVPAKVAAIEYDPNRSAYIALINYLDGAKSYILAPARLRVGMTVMSGPQAEIAVGNSL